MLAQATVLKIAGFAGQIVLAYVLAKDDFGDFALAALVAAAVAMIHQNSLVTVLVARGQRLDRWMSPAFWYSLTTGAIAAVATFLAAPVASLLFKDSRIMGLVFVFGVIPLFNSISVVPLAMLQSQLRFRAISIVSVCTGIGTTLLTIVLAFAGFKAYSFVIPMAASSVASAAIFWRLSQPTIRWRPQFRRWRLLMGDAGFVQLVAVMGLILAQADNFTLGCLRPAAVVGVYFFAFSLAMQPLQFLAGNLTGVLFPVMSQMRDDPVRQTRAMIRAARELAIIGLPICAAQAFLGRPLLTIVYHGRWDEAVAPFQMLSIGAGFLLISGPASALLQSTGRFRAYVIWATICAAAFVGSVVIGATLGGALSVSVAVMLFYVVFGPLGVYVAISAYGGRARDVLEIFFPPIAASLIAFGVPSLVMGRLGARIGNWGHVWAISLLAAPIYTYIVRTWMRPDFDDLKARLTTMARKTSSRFRHAG